MFCKSNKNQFDADGLHDVDVEDGAYVGAEHVHVLAQAEVVVWDTADVAVLLLVVKHIRVDNLLASEHKDDYHMIIFMTCKG